MARIVSCSASELRNSSGVPCSKDSREHGPHFVEHVLAGVDVHEAAGDDLRVADQLPVAVDGDDDDDEAVLGEVLAVAHDHLRHLLRLRVDEDLAVRRALLEDAQHSPSISATCPFVITMPCGTPTLSARRAWWMRCRSVPCIGMKKRGRVMLSISFSSSSQACPDTCTSAVSHDKTSAPRR